MKKVGCVWFRRDLRTYDHHALSVALKECDEVYAIFIFDHSILKNLPKDDRRMTFIYESLVEMEKVFSRYKSSLKILSGEPKKEIEKFLKDFNVNSLYLNRDYEPYAKERDLNIQNICKKLGVSFNSFKDSIIYEKNQIKNQSGKVYKVFTPYKNKWLEEFNNNIKKETKNYSCDLTKLKQWNNKESILKVNFLKKEGFDYQKDNLLKGGSSHAKLKLQRFERIINDYDQARDIPSLEKTSYLSPYIRHGNLSIREMVHLSLQYKKEKGANVWLSELIWREFYQMILDTFPHVTKGAFKKDYDAIKWVKNNELLKKWKEGQTGFPIIDASMRCLNSTGLMHNRLRMIVASFLCKTLLLDWKKGEEYFALKLLDFDLAANNGGWQWSASTGTDAQPYFRIFNPFTQVKKFDPEAKFIKTWCPELKDVPPKVFYESGKLEEYFSSNDLFEKKPDYPKPIVSYEENREKAISMYKKALNSSSK